MNSSGMTEIDITVKHRASPEFAPSPLALTLSIHMGEHEEHSIGGCNARFPSFRVPLSLAQGEGAARVRVAHQSGSPTSVKRSRLAPIQGTMVHDNDHLHILHTASESCGQSRSRSRSRSFRARPITRSPGTRRTTGFLRRPPRGGHGHGARVSPPRQGAHGGPGVRGGNGNQHPGIPPTFPKAHSTSVPVPVIFYMYPVMCVRREKVTGVRRNRFTLPPSTAPIHSPTTAGMSTQQNRESHHGVFNENVSENDGDDDDDDRAVFAQDGAIISEKNQEGLRARLEKQWDAEQEKHEKIMERIGEKERYKTKADPPASSSDNNSKKERRDIERRKKEEDRVIYDHIIARLAELDNSGSITAEPGIRLVTPSTPSTTEPMSPTSPTSTSSTRPTPTPRSSTSQTSSFLSKKIATFPRPSPRLYNKSTKRESEEGNDCMGEWGYGSTHDVEGSVGKKWDDVVDSRDQEDERQAKRALIQDVGYHRMRALSTAHSLASKRESARRLLQNLRHDEWDSFSDWYVNCWIGWDSSMNDYTWWDSTKRDKIICSRQVHLGHEEEWRPHVCYCSIRVPVRYCGSLFYHAWFMYSSLRVKEVFFYGRFSWSLTLGRATRS